LRASATLGCHGQPIEKAEKDNQEVVCASLLGPIILELKKRQLLLLKQDFCESIGIRAF
jgi:hypothetical protein